MISLRNAVVILIFLASALSACSSSCEAQERTVGKILRVILPTEIYNSALRISIDAVKGETLYPGDILKTGSSGLAAAVFPDGSQIVLNRNSSVVFRRRDSLTLNEGQILAEIRGERTLTISTPEGEITVKNGHAQALITVNKTEDNTQVSVFSGDLTLANSMGKARISAQRKAIITRLVTPHPVGDTDEKDYKETAEWADFDAPSIIVLIQQLSLGEQHSDSYTTAEIEKLLSQHHFQVVTSESIKGYGDSQIQELARKGMQGDMAAMRELAEKLQVELIMTGKVKTALLGQVGQGIVSCGAHGVLKVYEAKSGKLLLTREGNSTSIQRNPPLASLDALEKLVTTFSGTISWDIVQSLAENLPPSPELSHIHLDVLECSDRERKTIIEKLRTNHEVKKIVAGPVEKGKLSISLYTAASAKTIAGMLERLEIGILKIVGIKNDRVTAKIVKKKP